VRAGSVSAAIGPVAQSGRAPAWHAGGRGFKSHRVHLPLSLDFLSVVGFTLGGVVAGEGSFSTARILPSFKDGRPRLRFVFDVRMAARDLSVLQALREFLGVGSLNMYPPRRADWQPIAAFSVRSRPHHHRATIPFAERFLLPGAKRRQFEAWRDALYEYEAAHPTRYGLGPSPCRIDGCGTPVRGRGLCRSHYYRETGY
jgi:hypothetical protein